MINALRVQRTSTVVAVVFAAISLAACGDEQRATSGASYPANLAQYALPLDQFGRIDDDLTDYALGTLVKPCMEQAGYEWPLPDPPSAGGKHPADFNGAGRRLFDVAIATRFGYHLDPVGAPDPAAVALNQRRLTSSERSRLRGCQRAAFKQLPPDNQVSELFGSLGGAAYESAKNDAGVQAAAEKWRDCLKPQGVSDLPTLPTMMPADSLAREFGLSGGASQGTATPKEIRLAVADARCRASSGYAKRFYEIEFEKQLNIVDDNKPQLEAAHRTVVRHNRLARLRVQRYRG